MSETTPEHLFKYYGPERLQVLVDRKVRFTPASQFNDPCEFLIRPDDALDKDEMLSKWNYKRLKDEAAPDIQKMLDKRISPEALAALPRKQRRQIRTKIKKVEDRLPRLVARAEIAGKPMIESAVENDIPNLFAQALMETRTKFGVLCMTEKAANYPMWAHYASNHKGFVLRFNTTSLVSADIFRPRGLLWNPLRVRYFEHKHFSVQQDPDPDVLVSKHSDWSYEAEWRVIAPLEDVRGYPNYVGNELVELPSDAIEAVYLGAEFNYSIITAEILAGAVFNGIEIRIMEHDYRNAQLTHKRLGESS